MGQGQFMVTSGSHPLNQYVTLMSPKKGETAVCSSSIFRYMTSAEAITGCLE